MDEMQEFIQADRDFSAAIAGAKIKKRSPVKKLSTSRESKSSIDEQFKKASLKGLPVVNVKQGERIG